MSIELVELRPTDLHFIVRRIPSDVRKMMSEQGRSIILGGGFIRDTIAGIKPSDIDLFGPTKGVLLDRANELSKTRRGRVHTTDNAYTVLAPPRLPLQLITRWLYEEPSKVVLDFDFTVCQAALWFDKVAEKWCSAAHPDFYADLAARRLVYTVPRRVEDAGGSMMRVRKFLGRGWTIQAPSLGAVIARLAMAVRWDEVRDNEAKAAIVIAGKLREVDPLLMVDGLDVGDEHERVDSEAPTP